MRQYLKSAVNKLQKIFLNSLIDLKLLYMLFTVS